MSKYENLWTFDEYRIVDFIIFIFEYTQFTQGMKEHNTNCFSK